MFVFEPSGPSVQKNWIPQYEKTRTSLGWDVIARLPPPPPCPPEITWVGRGKMTVKCLALQCITHHSGSSQGFIQTV